MNVLAQAVANAHRAVRDRDQFEYTEGPERMRFERHPWPAAPTKITCDCSSTVTYFIVWAGAPDPNGLNSDGWGYTGTLLTHDQHVAAIATRGRRVKPGRVRIGDLAVYGPFPGWHVGYIVEVTADGDVLTVSHGAPGGPGYCWTAQPLANPHGIVVDGRLPVTFVRPSYHKIGPVRRAIRKRLPAIPLRHRRLYRPTPGGTIGSFVNEAITTTLG